MSRWQIGALSLSITAAIVGVLFFYQHTRPKPMDPRIVEVWKRLPNSESACPSYDYWPKGGIRNFYCHVATLLTLPQISKAFGKPIFVSGPHKNSRVNLNAENDFGRYNPEFVDFLGQHFIPRDRKLIGQLAPIFEGFIQRIAVTAYKAILILESNPERFEEEAQFYRDYIRADNYQSMDHPLNRYVDFIPGEYYPESYVGFWVRRKIDGTYPRFKELLVELLTNFVPDQVEILDATLWRYPETSFLEHAEGDVDRSENLALNYSMDNGRGIVKNLWTAIAETKNRCPDLYDYWPEGGLRIAYCHALDIIDVRKLVEVIGIDAFAKGPHSDGNLDLGNPTEFGHYRPEFVRWIVDNAFPAEDDEGFRRQTQIVYDTYLRTATRTWYLADHLLQVKGDFFKEAVAEYDQYRSTEEQGLLPFYGKAQEYFWKFEQEMDGPSYMLYPSAISFWLRREIDGTRPIFREGMVKLINIYDASFISTVEKFNVADL